VRFIDRAEEALGETTVRRLVKEGKPLPLEWNERPADRYPQMQNARNFANKIWNAARFVSSSENADSQSIEYSIDEANLDLASRWILARLDNTVESVTQSLQSYEFERRRARFMVSYGAISATGL
jgi:valyl-tRNA synthetase